jgi:hypothetical protein
MSAGFDAVYWFRQASGDEIAALAEIGWGGSGADYMLAKIVPRQNADARAVRAYCRANNIVWELYINEQDADLWLCLCRPLIQNRLREEARIEQRL